MIRSENEVYFPPLNQSQPETITIEVNGESIVLDLSLVYDFLKDAMNFDVYAKEFNLFLNKLLKYQGESSIEFAKQLFGSLGRMTNNLDFMIGSSLISKKDFGSALAFINFLYSNPISDEVRIYLEQRNDLIVLGIMDSFPFDAEPFLQKTSNNIIVFHANFK